MRDYTTQMDAARRGVITPEMKAVAAKEYRMEEEIPAFVILTRPAHENLLWMHDRMPVMLLKEDGIKSQCNFI